MKNHSSTSTSSDAVSNTATAQSAGIVSAWYGGAWWLYVLFPLSLIYFLIVSLRRALYRLGIFSSYNAQVPVIVVGNITLGGTGKSPLTSALVIALRAAGFNPGIASRGYGASIDKNEVREVLTTSSTAEVGDEPLMLKKMLDCPVYVSPARKLAVAELEAQGCDVIICDDGLQHYALNRDIELCVFDGERGVGNGLLLPAGPLREPVSRISRTDAVVINGADSLIGAAQFKSLVNAPVHDHQYRMDLHVRNMRNLGSSQELELASFSQKRVHAVAAIGNPERFFKTLESRGIELVRHAFDDHHTFKSSDFSFEEKMPIIMTEKDAVKCSQMALDDAWYVPVNAQIDQDFFDKLVDKLKEVKA